ncbi:MAG: hypothetical protein ACHP84_17645 [Caulobacterales bacterium]
MAAIDIGQATGAGFSLIRRRPLSVLTWSLVYALFFALAVWLMLPAFGVFIHLAQLSAAGLKDQAQAQAEVPRMVAAVLQFYSVALLVNVGVFVLQAVVTAAVFRAVLAPEKRAFAYMRLGMAELYLVLILFGERIVFGFGVLILALPFLIVIAVMAANHAWVAAAATGVAAGLLIVIAAIWAALRLSLVGPMTVADNQFRLAEGWRLTRGHVMSLFGVGLLLVLIVVAIELVLEGVTVAIGAGAIAVVAGGWSHLPGLATLPPLQVLSAFAPALIIIVTLWLLFIGAAQAIFGAPWAKIYLQLSPPALAPAPAAPPAEAAPPPADAQHDTA